MDNPCHLAVLHDLARGSGGWSDAALLGFPAAAIHSPFWYGLLGRLVAWGVPAGLLLALFDFAGFVAPPLAVLAVTRRRAPLWAATVVAWLALVQRPWLAGFESPLAGMALFGLASACLVLVVGELAGAAGAPPGPRRVVRLGALLGLLGLTHLFLVVPAALACALAWLPELRRGGDRRRLRDGLLAAALGALACAPFWLPALRDLGQLVIRDRPVAPHLGLLYLLLPLHPVALADGRLLWLKELAFTDVVPMALLVGLGLCGLRVARRDPVARLGLLLAGTLALIVLLIVPLTGLPLLGPFSWRRLFLVRLGLALAAAGALDSLPGLCRLANRRAVVVAAAAVLVLSGAWWQRPLRLATPPPDSAAVAQLAQAWRWLSEHRTPQDGRLYVQDTFGLAAGPPELRQSHLPALTARESGWAQVGAFYGGMPVATETWTAAQFGQICGRSLLTDQDLARVGRLLPAAGVTRMLLANASLAQRMADTGFYRVAMWSGPFAVLDPLGAAPRWVEPGPGVTASVTERSPGRWRLIAESREPGGTLTLSLAWAPGWRLEGVAGARVRGAPDGRLLLADLPAGRHEIGLRYRPDRRPWLVGAVGWLGLGALAIGRRRPASAPANARP